LSIFLKINNVGVERMSFCSFIVAMTVSLCNWSFRRQRIHCAFSNYLTAPRLFGRSKDGIGHANIDSMISWRWAGSQHSEQSHPQRPLYSTQCSRGITEMRCVIDTRYFR